MLKQQMFTRVKAELLLNIPGLERLNPARLQDRFTRQLLPDANTAQGMPKEKMNVLSDVAALTCFKHSKNARLWSMRRPYENENTAPSLVYMQNVQQVSFCDTVPLL